MKAYSFSLASAVRLNADGKVTGEYCDFKAPQLSYTPPSVPPGAVKNHVVLLSYDELFSDDDITRTVNGLYDEWLAERRMKQSAMGASASQTTIVQEAFTAGYAAAINEVAECFKDAGGKAQSASSEGAAKLQRVLNDPCVQKLADDEPFFVLLGRDIDAFYALSTWIERRLKREGRLEKVSEAQQTLDEFRAYYDKQTNDNPLREDVE